MTSDGTRAVSRRHAIVLTGGDPVDPDVAGRLPPDAYVVAADSGLHVADTLALAVDRVVGDLDSVDATRLKAARRAGIPVDVHPRAKDRTDLAIALDAALEADVDHITVVGGHGGRLDHLAANLSLIASPCYAEVEMSALMGRATVTIVRHATVVVGRRGELVSLLPMHGPAHGVRTSGLRFPLEDEDLTSGSSRGVSNELVRTHADVRLREGCLAIIQPGEFAAP